MLFSLVSCNHSDPEIKRINNNYCLATSPNGVILNWNPDDSDSLESDRIIIDKNFVAYTVQENNLLLCEQLEDNSQDFWSFDLETEDLKNYKKYSEFAKKFNISDDDWEALWIPRFKLQKD